MEITLEQVERLREKADVSYQQAKQALEYSGGNLLDALIYLEEQGAIPRPQGAYYSTRNETPPPPPAQEELALRSEKKGRKEKKREKKAKGAGAGAACAKGTGKTLFSTLRRWLIDNELEIWRRDQPVTSLPILILILLVLFAPYLTLPLLVLGLFFGFRYQVCGPDLEDETFNGMMGSVADTASELGRQVMDELKLQHEKHEKNKDENKP